VDRRIFRSYPHQALSLLRLQSSLGCPDTSIAHGRCSASLFWKTWRASEHLHPSHCQPSLFMDAALMRQWMLSTSHGCFRTEWTGRDETLSYGILAEFMRVHPTQCPFNSICGVSILNYLALWWSLRPKQNGMDPSDIFSTQTALFFKSTICLLSKVAILISIIFHPKFHQLKIHAIQTTSNN